MTIGLWFHRCCVPSEIAAQYRFALRCARCTVEAYGQPGDPRPGETGPSLAHTTVYRLHFTSGPQGVHLVPRGILMKQSVTTLLAYSMIVGLILCLSTPALANTADQIVFTNGDKLTGRVLSTNDETVSFSN